MRTPEPLVVLLHGTRMSSAVWQPYRPLLPGIEICAPDLPGHGDRVGEEFTLATVEAVIDRAVAQRRPGQPVLLAGHSLGGYLASWWAWRHPDQVDALVLLGATADPRSRWAGAYRWFARLVPRVRPERLATFSNRLMWLVGARGDKAAALPDASGYAVLPQAWDLVMTHCSPDLLRVLDCPVVLANGQWDQMRADVAAHAAAAKRSRVVTVPRATHLMPITHPRQVAAIIAETVDELSGPADRP
ncbi:MAG TPA: alpha/beta hydrolase [Candidatus Avipropionibacterium avicola]|uniref:Alpha/beta hydrolase n=1 Tax=Candidatus Avipropionibacterium avicola TaxID=2840701 RepID=A0A9D1GYQ2_9ACTN|nr:alpha/beta hydrolase [Candidatus Avipropionibacterium avicola]